MHRPLINIRPETYCFWCVCLLLLPLKLVVAWFVSVFLHELFHLAAIYLSGGFVGFIQIGITGVKMKTGPMTFGRELLCAAAGPVGGVMFFLLLLRKIPILATFCLFHSIFNLIPLYPLDGGRVVHSLLGIICKSTQVDKRASIFDSCVSVLLLITVLFAVIRFALGPLPLVIVLILIFRNKKEKCS